MFEIQSTLSFNKESLVYGNEYDYITRTSQNQGILQETGFVNKENINSAGNWSLGLLQMDFFYRNKPWYAGQFVRKIIPKIEIKNNLNLFFSVILNQQKNKLLSVLVRDVDKTFKNLEVSLPTKNGKIDFDFMEYFIEELEKERINELNNYLQITGLKDYTLTSEEEKVLEDFENGKFEWGEFRMEKLFEKVKTNKLLFSANDLVTEQTTEYSLPCLTSSFKNQGLNYYAPKENATILKNVISIPSNSDVYRAYFQSKDFTVLSDAYAIDWIYEDLNLSNNHYLFAVQCINKVTDLQIYSYKNKLGGWNVVKNKSVQLPKKGSEPDFELMEIFISAIQKVVVKDLVDYVERKM